jgi:2,4-dienoyl-CoA reductase (NADPH2)
MTQLHQRFHLKDKAQLEQKLTEFKLSLPLSDNWAPLGDAVPIGRLQTPNRFIVQPMEGFDAEGDGRPGELSFRRYSRYAAGGSGLIWFEATAVLPEARSNPGQFYLYAGNVDAYARLVEATRRAAREKTGSEPVLVLQLTHSGRYCKPTGIPKPIIAHHSPILDPKHNLPPDYPLVTDEYLDRLQDQFVAAARLAAQAGFDGIDVKSCHRYLTSELLASHTREGRYGGSFENRTRLLRESLARIKAEVPGVFICTRMSAFDAIAHPYGFGVDRSNGGIPDLDEPKRLAKELQAIGIALLNISIGNPYFNPHYGRPFDFPIAGLSVPGEHPLEAITRFADITRQIQSAIPDIPVVASGYTWLRHLMPYLAAGVVREKWATLVGQGRGAFAYPESVIELLRDGRMDPEKCCVTCSACTQIMRDGGKTGCVVRDSEIYGPEYREARRFAVDRLQEEARRCRDCEFPTCTRGCPARIEIPAFLKAFADGNFKQAYAVLQRNNALPEMCGYVCPAEVQCEGACVEEIFCKRPLPIRDIQLVISRIARREGWTGVQLPAVETGKTVAVVGAGPAGLGCAIRLLEKGHRVALFDKATQWGGVPQTIIPGERLESSAEEISGRLDPALKAGRLILKLGQALGPHLTLEDLRQKYAAVFLAVGLGESVRTATPVPGVTDALTFLREVKQGTCKPLGARVAVIGGGNTAIDAAVTAKRQGARDVYLVYRRSYAEMPAWPMEREHLLASGGHLMMLMQPAGYVTDAAGRLTGLKIQRTVLGEPDASGRRRPEPVPDSLSVLAVDQVIEATGQKVPEELKTALGAVALTPSGALKMRADSTATSLRGVYAGGDLVNGGTTAVRGIAEGIAAAEEISRALAEIK